MKREIEIRGLIIAVEHINQEEYISLTDIARQSERRPAEVIRDWLRNANTLSFLEEWEKLHNPTFKVGHMPHFKSSAQSNRKAVSTGQFIQELNAIGLMVQAGRYGGTYAHKDIALHFCNWFEPAFYVYMIKAFQKLVESRYDAQNLEWHVRKITDGVDEIRNLLDTIPGQNNNKFPKVD